MWPGKLKLSPARLIELVLLLALIFLVSFLYMERLNLLGQVNGEHAQPRQQSIAVMPFANMSDSTEVEYFGDGLAEEILNLLSRLDELDVAARTSSFYFKNKDVDIPTIAEHLGVRYILEGSVRRQGDQARITAQLIDAQDGYHLWSETYDGDFRDSFLVQDEIARQVVSSLQLLLSEVSVEILESRPDLVPAAYDYYLRGRDYLRSSLSMESRESAAELFEKAIEIDGGYAEAYAGLCDTYLDMYRRDRDQNLFMQAQTACETSLTLEKDALPVHVALGNLYRYSGRHDAAIKAFGRALSLDLDSVEALVGLGATYQRDNKPGLAEENFLLAIRRQPRDWRGYHGMGGFLFSAGRFEEAIPYYQRITELMPDNAEALNDLGASYYMMGDFEPAVAAWARSLELEPTAMAYGNAGSALFFLRRFTEASGMYRKALEFAPDDYQNWGALADAHRFIDGGMEDAEREYRRAIDLANQLLEVNASDAMALAMLAHYAAVVGDRETALQAMAQAIALAPQDLYVHYNNALMLTTLNELDKAAAALDEAVALGYSMKLARMDAGLDKLLDKEAGVVSTNQ